MTTPFENYVSYLKSVGLSFEVFDGLVQDENHDGNLIEAGERPRRFPGLAPKTILEWDDLEAGLGSDHASLGVAREIARIGSDLKGMRVLELGCGTGLLAIQAALFGAEVLATDLDQEALDLAGRNAKLNEVRLDLRFGSLADPIEAHEVFDLVVANLPHKPAPHASDLPLAQNGGPEGDSLFAELQPFFRNNMKEGGRLLFFMHSLPHPRLLVQLSELFDLRVRRWKLRYILDGEYSNLIESFRERCQNQLSFMHKDSQREALVACIWEGTKKRSHG